jgi:hypothetical protein
MSLHVFISSKRKKNIKKKTTTENYTHVNIDLFCVPETRFFHIVIVFFPLGQCGAYKKNKNNKNNSN